MSAQTLRCSLTLADGSRRALTGLRSWELVRTDGDACDSFSVTADLPASGLGRLTEAVGFLAEQGGVRVFTGLIDEYELALDAGGSALRVHGRGMGARLLDNQVAANVWRSAQLADILATYVTPYGLKASACALPAVASFAVSSGNTCMQVVKGFCIHAGALVPRFDANGTLLVSTARPSSGQTLRQSQLLSAVYRDCRYGVISRQTVLHTATGAVSEAFYPAFSARGGLRREVVSTGGSDLRAVWRTAQQRIDAAREDEFTLQATVAGSFFCEPGTILNVSLPKLGLSGDLNVRQVRSCCSEEGCLCTLTLFR
ncbi:MAG: hypothetical protein ACI3VX_04385 [Faecousia sp.]